MGTKVNTFNMDDKQLSLFLDLINAGYKNALVSVVDFDFGETQIEIILQNVGTLRVNQSFNEINDEQRPNFEVSYIIASHPKILQKIENHDLKHRAVRIAYDCKKYFESHPEHIVDQESSLIKRIRKNKDKILQIYKEHQRTRNRWLLPLDKHK